MVLFLLQQAVLAVDEAVVRILGAELETAVHVAPVASLNDGDTGIASRRAGRGDLVEQSVDALAGKDAGGGREAFLDRDEEVEAGIWVISTSSSSRQMVLVPEHLLAAAAPIARTARSLNMMFAV